MKKEIIYSKTYISETGKKDFKISPELLAEEAKQGSDRYVSQRLLEDEQTLNKRDVKIRDEIGKRFGSEYFKIEGSPKTMQNYPEKNVEYETRIFIKDITEVSELERFLIENGFN